ncbi:hypothetical protein TanjilG_19797 [Lupinus angustifolius]|uniref:Transmembrane protein n=1 Tax=Lupinus angustifolius TaxID=3871 RepID=A0A1J7GXH0_LUPAN|nr:hypothetical protein TanjilG_19797 [Lupinus angustifolius]
MSNLNGTYHGPAIPPPPLDYDCCCGYIFNLIFKVILGVIVFLFWLIVCPNKVKVAGVTDGSWF